MDKGQGKNRQWTWNKGAGQGAKNCKGQGTDLHGSKYWMQLNSMETAVKWLNRSGLGVKKAYSVRQKTQVLRDILDLMPDIKLNFCCPNEQGEEKKKNLASPDERLLHPFVEALNIGCAMRKEDFLREYHHRTPTFKLRWREFVLMVLGTLILDTEFGEKTLKNPGGFLFMFPEAVQDPGIRELLKVELSRHVFTRLLSH